MVEQQEQRFDCKLKGKKRQLRVAQMTLGIFDGQKHIASYLYEKIDSWEYQPDTTTLRLSVVKSNSEGSSGTETK